MDYNLPLFSMIVTRLLKLTFESQGARVTRFRTEETWAGLLGLLLKCGYIDECEWQKATEYIGVVGLAIFALSAAEMGKHREHVPICEH